MPALKRRILDLNGDRHWALYGMRGVVEFNLMDFDEYGTRDIDSRAFVGIHSPRPHEHGQGPCGTRCPFLEGICFIELSDSGGVWIATEWENAGFDDEAIWRRLEEFYNGSLAVAEGRP